MSTGIQFNINVQSNAGSVFGNVTQGIEKTTERTRVLTRGFSECVNKLLTFNQALEGIRNLQSSINDAIAPGIKLNTSLTDLSAITGQTGQGLKDIEKAARDSAKVFGTDAAQNVESYKLILSQLSPEIANSSEAMKAMGNNVNILSKTMGGDTTAATNVLTTAMNQYQVSLDDPIEASKTMASMMNVMAAAAKEGSAELPQIQAALANAGMQAKASGVSFEELNASIQVLDKAGKKGAEGGIAVRNVLAEIGKGRFQQKEVREELAKLGINTDKLANKNLTLSQRLTMLKPLTKDGALLTKMFGDANSAAALALIQGTDAMDEYKGKITGTNTAVEQADIVMGSYQEKLNRAKAKMDDWKISIFNATQAYMPMIQNTMSVAVESGKLFTGFQALSIVGGKLKDMFTGLALKKTIAAFATKIYTGAISGMRNMTLQATIAQLGLNAAMLANPIGLIIVGIMAVIGVFYYLWEHSEKFRRVLFGVWEAAKAVFHNIGVVIKRVWEMIIKPVFTAIAAVFSWLWDVAVSVWTGISDAAVAAFTWIWDLITGIGDAIADFFTGIWDWISGMFSGIVGFINEWIVQPIKNAFGGVWDFIVGIFNKILDKIKWLFGPIIKLWKKIFGGEGMEDISIAYKRGEEKGSESWHNSKDKGTAGEEETPAQKALEEKKLGNTLKNLGTNAANSATGSNKETGSSNKGPTTIHLKIEKIIGIENFRSGSIKEGAKAAGNMVVEELLMALNSVNPKLAQ